MKKKWIRVVALATAFVMTITCVADVNAATVADYHGTTSTVITEDMLNNTPPADYQVNLDMQGDAKDGEYNKYFLDDDVQTVKIEMDENNLNYLLQNGKSKPQVMTNKVTIGNESIGYAGIKTKGSYTLANVPDNNDRFSFTLNFGKYIKKKQYGVKQNFHGLSKVSFNNFFFDKSMLKEFCAWKVIQKMGLPTPQFGLAKLYINNQFYGVYFMMEAMDSTVIEQYKKVDSSEVSDYLVKPEGYRNVYDSSLDRYINSEGDFVLGDDLKKDEVTGEWVASGDLSQKIGGLWENDTDTLQDVAKTIPTVLKWQKKLNQLYYGKDFSGKDIDVQSDEYVNLLNEVMDVEECVRYYATHSFLVQTDYMFSGDKNFGVYVDKDGRLTMIPWDYDLSMGCFFPTTSSTTANFPLTQMYRKMEFDDVTPSEFLTSQENGYKLFPLFYVIYQNDKLMKKFRSYMKDCSKVAALGGTLSTGETMEPGYINSCVEKLEAKIAEAAAIKLASNVKYINASQPSGTKNGAPVAKKIYAMRSLGVYLQVTSQNYKAATPGCNLELLGNGQNDRFAQNRGYLAAIDPATGVFVENFYRDGSPTVTAKKVATTDPTYQAIKSQANVTSDGDVDVYLLSGTGTVNTEYTAYIPTSAHYKDGNVEMYTYSNGTLTKVDSKRDDNLVYGKIASLGYVATVKRPVTTQTNTSQSTTTTTKKAVKGKTYTVKKLKYKVTSTSKNTVTVVGPKSKSATSVTINSTVSIYGKKFKVTAIATNAFAKCKKLKKVVIGANVKTIGKKAFYKDSKLKSIVVKTKVLKSVGSNACKGIHKKAVIKVPSKKLAKYKKLWKKKGQASTVKIKK